MKIEVASGVVGLAERSMQVFTRLSALAMLVACLWGCAVDNRQGEEIVTRDQFIPHVSTLRPLAGQKVGIFVRQKAAASIANGRGDMRGRVVLFVHGATVPGVPAYDLDYQTYDWMAFLARAGFNVYTMDVSGYGSSPRPMMDDPCNVDPKQQRLLQGRSLKTACTPNYPYEFNTIHDDWAEMDTVVNHLLKSNDVERIHIIGWSAGGPRVGGYVAKHPAKIDRVMLYAPSPTVAGPIADRPSGGFPVALQTREDFEQKRWDPDVRCPGQVEPGVRDVVWRSIMEWDRVGASWRSSEGVMRARTATAFGWTGELATQVVAPTLVIVGEFDRLSERRAVYEQIGASEKVFVNVSCASHFMIWEKQHRALQYASLEWFRRGRVQGITRGEVRVDRDGRFFTP